MTNWILKLSVLATSITLIGIIYLFIYLFKFYLLLCLLTGQVLHSPNILMILGWRKTDLSMCFYSICLVVLHQNTTLLFFLLLYFIACMLSSSCARLNYVESNSNRLVSFFWLCTCSYLWVYISGNLHSGIMLFEIHNLQRWIIQFNWNVNYI